MADSRPAPKPKPAISKRSVVEDSNEDKDKKPAKKPSRSTKNDSGD